MRHLAFTPRARAALAAALLPAAGAAQEAALPAAEPLVRFGPFAFQVDGLAAPAAAAVDGAGRIFVVEEIGCRVRVFGPAGEPLLTFGARGSEPGRLLDPRGIALAPDGRVSDVADTGNHRVQVFEPDGSFALAFGGYGAGPGELIEPLGLAADEQRVYVADSGNDRVQVFDRDGRAALAFGGTGREPGCFNRPVDVALDPAGEVYVADRDNHRIQVFDRAGGFVRTWGDKGPFLGLFAAPTGLAFHAGHLYVADRDNHRIDVFDRRGKAVDEWGRHALRPHEGAGRFHYPNDVALAPSGALAVVCESFEDRFQVYVPGERPPESVVDASQQDPTPHYGPRVAARGRVCAIAEPARPSVLVFNVSGVAIEITRLARHGRKAGQLLAPVDAEIHPALPRVYVADAGTARISIFHLDLPDPEHLRQDPLMGRFVKSLDLAALARDPAWDGPRPIEPGALAFDRDGNLWLVDPLSCRVLALDPELALLRVFGRRGARPEELSGPVDLALSPDGATIYLVDARDRRVKAFDREGRFRFAFGGPADEGAGPGRFVRPAGIAVGEDGRVHVSDEGAHKVLAFDERGRFTGELGRPGLGRLELHKPAGLAFDGAGRLFVLDHGNHRCQVLARDGSFVEAFGPQFFIQPANRPDPGSRPR